MKTGKRLFDPDEVSRAISVLFRPGQVFEVRITDAIIGTNYSPYTASGYFRHDKKGITALLQALATVREALNVYVTLQEIDSRLFARAPNRLRSFNEMKKGPTTDDKAGQRLRWLPIDADTERPADISTTDREHELALQKAHQIRDELRGLGWPDPFEGDSGNGGHLGYAIDLPPEDSQLLKQFLQVLSARHSDGTIKIDTTVYNPARIWKLYGSRAGKGEDFSGDGDLEARPHRISRLLNVPTRVCVTREQIEAYIAMFAECRAQVSPPKQNTDAKTVGGPPLQPLLSGGAIDYTEEKDESTGQTKYFLPNGCLFNPEHKGTSVCLVEYADGGWKYCCKHNGCAGKTKVDVLDLLDPERQNGSTKKQHRQEDRPGPMPSSNGHIKNKDNLPGSQKFQEADAPKPKRKFTYACDVEEKDIEWLWEGRLAKGCLTLGVGDPGLGKGLTIAAIIRAVTRGESLPGGPTLPAGGVILMSPEDPTSQVLIPRLKAAGADLTKVLLLTEIEETDHNTGETYMRPTSFPEDAAILREAIEDAGAVLVIIDPVLSLLSGKVDAHKNHAVRQALAHVISTANNHNCAVFGILHLNRSNNANVLYRSSSSNAFIEMARTALYFVPDPDGEQGQSGVIVNYKNNLARHASSIRYSIHHNAKNIGFIKWNGESERTRDELLNQHSATNNKKSEREDEIVAVLKRNKLAMTVEEILPHTDHNFHALRKMLTRKADDGIIWRTSRGKYTYAGNPLYIKDDDDNDDVSNVSTSQMSQMSQASQDADEPASLRHDVSNENGTEAAPEDDSESLRHLRHQNTQQTMSLSSSLDIPQVGDYVRCPDGKTGKVTSVSELSIDVDVYGQKYHYTADKFPLFRKS